MGRPKGAKNKHTFKVEEIAQKFDVEPFEIMMRIASGDHAFFGFDAPTKVTYSPQGIEVEELNIPMRERAAMAKEASKYLYSAKQAIQVAGQLGIKIIVEDFLSKEERND